MKKAALFFVVLCLASCSDSENASGPSVLFEQSASSITGKYYSIRESKGATGSLRVLNITSATKERVVYDLAEYEFNNEPSNLDNLHLLGAVSVTDPTPEITMNRRRSRLPTPYSLTGTALLDKKGVEAPVVSGKPVKGAVACYRYATVGQAPFTFEFCEDGYQVISDGSFLREEKYPAQSAVRKVIAANPGFPDTVPAPNSGSGVTASRKSGPQNVVTDIQYDGEIIGRAAVCLSKVAPLPQEEENKIGAAYLRWMVMTYGREDAAPFFYILKEALIVGEKSQQKEGMTDCDKRIAAFDELAQIIGYQRPNNSPGK
ncbi:MAG: hypothetical protein DELT_01691 [Desulfovibrio sp.]